MIAYFFSQNDKVYYSVIDDNGLVSPELSYIDIYDDYFIDKIYFLLVECFFQYSKVENINKFINDAIIEDMLIDSIKCSLSPNENVFIFELISKNISYWLEIDENSKCDICANIILRYKSKEPISIGLDNITREILYINNPIPSTQCGF